jgi:hypothetical protein
MIRPRRFLVAASALMALGCADTNAPLPAPEEVLLVVNSTANTLTIVPVEAPANTQTVELGGTTPTPVGVSARKAVAIVPLGLDNAAAVVDLRSATVVRTIPLPANSGATGSTIVDDSIAYVGNPNLGSISRINYLTGETLELPTGVYPQGLIFTRGKLFVMDGNLDKSDPNLAPAGPSWITVVDPVTNKRAGDRDSIPLTGEGNAGFADVGGDGMLYVMNTGSYFTGEGRLSVVDPVTRLELASHAGLGTGPGNVTSDGQSRLLISSFSQGVMEFDLERNKVVKGAGEGIPIPSNSAVLADSKGRVYALESGPCSGGHPGIAHVLDDSLKEIRTITLGECPSGGAVVQIPPAETE